MKKTNAPCRRRDLPVSRAGVTVSALLASVLMAGLFVDSSANKLAQDVSVTIDYQAPSVVSKLEIGVTHTHVKERNRE